MESRVRYSRYAYLVVAWLFVVGILTQVFLIGLTFIGGRPSLETHTGLGHGLSGFVLLMIVFAHVGRLPRPMKPFTWLAFVIYVLLADVVIFMRGSTPVVAALHPVLAVLLFGVTGFLAINAWRLLRETSNAVTVSHLAADATGN